MSVTSLASAVKVAMNERIGREARAIRATIRNGQLVTNARSYDFTQAVDVNVHNGRRVWALRAQNGKAVIVGA